MKINPKVTRIFIMIVIAIAVIYDIFIAITKSWESTLSYQTWCASHKFMFIPLALGTVVSHFTAPDMKLHKYIPKLRMILWISVAVIFLVWSIITMPVAPIHPFIMLFIGIANGLLWHQTKIEE